MLCGLRYRGRRALGALQACSERARSFRQKAPDGESVAHQCGGGSVPQSPPTSRKMWEEGFECSLDRDDEQPLPVSPGEMRLGPPVVVVYSRENVLQRAASRRIGLGLVTSRRRLLQGLDDLPVELNVFLAHPRHLDLALVDRKTEFVNQSGPPS